MIPDFDLARTRVILIGTSESPNDPMHLPPLPAVRFNLSAMMRAFEDESIVGIDYRNIFTILDADTPSDITRRLARIAKQATDTLIVYYAGHGIISRRNRELLLATYSTTEDECDQTALKFEELKQAISNSIAKKKIVILDCCYSGRAFVGHMGGLGSFLRNAIDRKPAGACWITATNSNTEAKSPEGSKYTAFTGELLSVLENGIPEVDALTLDRVFKEVRARLLAREFPEPQFYNHQDGGNLIVAKNRPVRPLFTPPDPGSSAMMTDRQNSSLYARAILGTMVIAIAVTSAWSAIFCYYTLSYANYRLNNLEAELKVFERVVPVQDYKNMDLVFNTGAPILDNEYRHPTIPDIHVENGEEPLTWPCPQHFPGYRVVYGWITPHPPLDSYRNLTKLEVEPNGDSFNLSIGISKDNKTQNRIPFRVHLILEKQ